MAKYSDLTNVGGTIYNKSGKGYKNPKKLAADLGIKPHEIDWGQISEGSQIPGQAPPVPLKPKTLASPATPDRPPQDISKPTSTPDEKPVPGGPDVMAPENTLSGIRTVFGKNWEPADIFKERGLTNQGIYGAVRVPNSKQVYTIGPGGEPLSGERYEELFGVPKEQQEGIVGDITRDQAIALGIESTTLDEAAERAPSGISEDQLKQKDQKEAPGGDVDTSDADATAAGAEQEIKTIEDYMKLFEGEDTTIGGKTLDDLVEEHFGTVSDQKPKAEMQQEEEQERNLEQKKTQLTTIKNKIQTRLAEFNQTQADLQELSVKQEGKPISMAHIQGNQAQIRRELQAAKNSKAADISILQSMAQGIRNEIQTAQESANRSVNLRWSAYQSRIKNQRYLIDLLRTEMNEDQKKRARAVEMYLQDEQRRIEKQKQEEKQTQQLMTQVAASGVSDTNVLDSISNADSYEEALKIASPYLQGEVSGDTQIITANGRKLLVDKATGETIKDLGYAYQQDGDDGDSQIDKFKEDFNDILQNMIEGEYGREGAREKVIQVLQAKARVNYPSLVDEIPKMVYGEGGYDPLVPDGYESGIVGSGSDSSNNPFR